MTLAHRRNAILTFGLCIAVTALTACGHPVERRLQGRWLGESVENFDGPALAAVTGWARGTSFEFSGEKLTVAIPAEDPRSGTFEVAAFRDAKAVLSVKRADGQVDRLELKLDDELSMRWLLPEGRSIVMRKVD
ncbi:MAG: hypothetical protein QM784_21765 [Polyangiaceae bacterium]